VLLGRGLSLGGSFGGPLFAREALLVVSPGLLNDGVSVLVGELHE